MKIILKGGKGSGHRGHRGRPGKVGGGVADNARTGKTLANMEKDIAEHMKSRIPYPQEGHQVWMQKFNAILYSYQPVGAVFIGPGNPAWDEWNVVRKKLEDAEYKRQAKDGREARRRMTERLILAQRSHIPENKAEAKDALMEHGFNEQEAGTLVNLLEVHPDGLIHAAWIYKETNPFVLEGIGSAAGSYSPDTDVISIYDSYFSPLSSTEFRTGALFHEISHMKWQRLNEPDKLLTEKAQERAKNMFKNIRQLDSTSKDFNSFLLKDVIAAGERVSSYANVWWKRYKTKPSWSSLTSALNETFAEITYNKVTGRRGSSAAGLTSSSASGMDWYMRMYKELNSLYDEDLKVR